MCGWCRIDDNQVQLCDHQVGFKDTGNHDLNAYLAEYGLQSLILKLKVAEERAKEADE